MKSIIKVSVLIAAILLSACGQKTQEVAVTSKDGLNGRDGQDGYTTYIITKPVSPMSEQCGMSGGLEIVPYTDFNRNGVFDEGEQTVLASSVICNGAKGEVGLTGATGAVGTQGPKGEPGIQGIPGYSSQGGMTPVKLCANDSSQYPEYGFVIGNSLYAVYYGVINGTLNAFMARLTPGSYMSTNSTNCTFTYSVDDSGNQYLNNVAIVPTSRGLVAQVHNLPNWDNVTLPNLFVGNPTLGTFVVQNLNVGDTHASNGFPGMPSALQQQVGYDGYALDINGYINVPTTGNYIFKMFSDDGAILLINDQVVIADDSLHSPRTATSQAVRLNAGLNRINVLYYQGPQSQIALQLKWSGPNLSEQVIPATALSH